MLKQVPFYCEGAIQRLYDAMQPMVWDEFSIENMVAQAMLDRLDLIKHEPRYVLDVGSGFAQYHHLLAIRYPGAHLLGLDLAKIPLKYAQEQYAVRPSLLHRLKANFLGVKIVNRHLFVQADMAHLPFKQASMDCVFSNMALPWLSYPDDFLKAAANVLIDDGLLMVSTLGVGSFRALSTLWTNAGLDDPIHPCLDIHDWGDALLNHGFEHPVLDVLPIYLNYQSFDRFIADCRRFQFFNQQIHRSKGLITPRQWARLEKDFLAMVAQSGSFTLTVEIVFAHAWKTKRPEHLIGELPQSRPVIKIHTMPS
jgi:malonyl-CoA O-methyltransferase